MSREAHHFLMTRGGRLSLLAIVLAILAAVGIFGRLYGQHLAYGAMQERDTAIRQLEVQSQQRELDMSDQHAQVAALETQLGQLRQQLSAIVPSKNVYGINPNQSLLVADGHLTIGLIGNPLSNGIEINVNGKQQFVTVGDVIHVSPDASTSCDVQIQSFDMFKAYFTASCGTAKT
jgi:hypothetical protein